MATQLTRVPLKARIMGRMGPLDLPPRVLIVSVLVAALAALASLIAGIHNSGRDEAVAQRRFADAQALLAAPPVSPDTLQTQLDAVNGTLATVQARSSAPSIDARSDDLTALLVRRAQVAGLTVRAIARGDPMPASVQGVAYDTQSVRVTVEGDSEKVIAFLADVGSAQPALVPALNTMTIDGGRAHAEIIFTSYAKSASPTPAPRAERTPVKRQ